MPARARSRCWSRAASARRWRPLAAVAVVIGHIFPVWLGFNGGKGVATTGGVLLAYAWPVGLAALATWLAVALVTRYSSLAALVASVLAPLYAWLFTGDGMTTATVLVVALLVVIAPSRQHSAPPSRRGEPDQARRDSRH